MGEHTKGSGRPRVPCLCTCRPRVDAKAAYLRSLTRMELIALYLDGKVIAYDAPRFENEAPPKLVVVSWNPMSLNKYTSREAEISTALHYADIVLHQGTGIKATEVGQEYFTRFQPSHLFIHFPWAIGAGSNRSCGCAMWAQAQTI